MLSHEGQGSTAIGDNVEITEQEFDKLSKANVERWVSAHIIPVGPSLFSTFTHLNARLAGVAH